MVEPLLTLPDVNVLVALTHTAHAFHTEAHRWLSGVERFATTPVTETGLLRLLLNPVVVGHDTDPRRGLAAVAAIRGHPAAEFLADGTSLAAPLISTSSLAGYRQVTDLHLLNLAARHDALLVTFDQKLARAALPADAARVLTLGG